MHAFNIMLLTLLALVGWAGTNGMLDEDPPMFRVINLVAWAALYAAYFAVFLKG